MNTRKAILAIALPAAALFAHAAHADSMFARVGTPASRLSTLDDATPMHVIVTLPLHDATGAVAFAKAVSNPSSRLYGHYLSPAEFGARFGADTQAYQAVRAWGAQHGLTVGRVTNARSSVTFSGTADQFASLFGTHFAAFAGAHTQGRVMTTAPSLPAELAGKVDSVIGLEDTGRIAMLARPSRAPVNSVGTGIDGYAPSDIKTAYNIQPQANPAKTEVLALFEQGGYPTSDLTTYLTHYNLPSVPVTRIAVNGSSTADNEADIEVDLDLDAVIGMNPALSQILMYIDSYKNDSFQTGLLDSLNQIADDNTATVVSISYGEDENQQGKPAIKAEGAALTQLVSQGIAVFASSGDDGAGGREGSGLNAPDPGSQPELTSVGGTALTVTSSEKWSKEVVWNDSAEGDGATGGGISDYWSIPSYQVVNGKSVAVANGGSSTMRNVPDIASDAAVSTPYSVYCAGYGGWLGVGGTSFSSPTWAAMLTIVNSNRVSLALPRTGFFNPLLYKLGVSGKNFHDIVAGNNGSPGYTAGPGYDNDTGFGSINLGKLMPKLTK